MADTTITVKSKGWKVKVALGLGGLIVLVILSFVYRLEFGVVVLVLAGILAVRGYAWAIGKYNLSMFVQRTLEAQASKLESEAVKAKAESFFVETNTGVFVLDGIVIASFYPAVTASKMLADTPLLLPASTEVKSYRKLLDVDFIHLLVTGPSDAGKTTVLCHLIDNSPFDTIVYVLDPHAKFNRWPNRVNEVIGRGRDYGAVDSKLVGLISEMDRRYNSDRMNFQKVLIVADEWLGILDNCPSAKGFFDVIGSESRKVNMSLVISSISATVDDLDVSGAIRDNLAQLTLSRTLKGQNLGEIKWSRADKELVELPGRYVYHEPMLPARVEPTFDNGMPRPEFTGRVTPDEIEPMPILDSGPIAPRPDPVELRIFEMYQQGKSLNAIWREVYPDRSYGGNQADELKAILARFGVSL